jgi:hypothetical protein
MLNITIVLHTASIEITFIFIVYWNKISDNLNFFI